MLIISRLTDVKKSVVVLREKLFHYEQDRVTHFPIIRRLDVVNVDYREHIRPIAVQQVTFIKANSIAHAIISAKNEVAFMPRQLHLVRSSGVDCRQETAPS